MNVLAGLPAPAPTPDGAAPTDAAIAAGGTDAPVSGELEALIAAILAATPSAPTSEAGTIADATVPADVPADDSAQEEDGATPSAPPAIAPAAALVAAILAGAQATAAATPPSSPATPPSLPSDPEAASAAVATARPGPAASSAAPATAVPATAVPATTVPSSVPDVPVPSDPAAAPANAGQAPVSSVPSALGEHPADDVPSVPSVHPANVAPMPAEPAAGQVPATDDTTTAASDTVPAAPEGTATTDPAVPEPVAGLVAPSPEVVRHLDPRASGPGVASVNATGRTAAAAAPHHVELPTTDPNVARTGGLVRTMAHGEVRAATLTLSPAELGEVRVELRSQDGVVSVHLSATHPEGLEALRNSTGTLRRELERAGLGLDRVDVGFSGDGAGQSSRQGSEERPTSDVDLGPAQPVRPFTSATRLTRPARPIPIRGESGLDLDL